MFRHKRPNIEIKPRLTVCKLTTRDLQSRRLEEEQFDVTMRDCVR
jgi:hypothetical protein